MFSRFFLFSVFCAALSFVFEHAALGAGCPLENCPLEAPDPEITHLQAQQLERYYNDQRRINGLEREILDLQAENKKLKIPAPKLTKKEKNEEHHEADLQALARKNEEFTNFCRRLLWDCQLPHAKKATCQKFTENCAGLEKTIGEMKINVPVDLPLGETEKFRPVGYLSPSGVVKGVHRQNLGYVQAGDIDSALMIAATANQQDHDDLPDNFPHSSLEHPYKITEKDKQILHQEIMPHRNECGLLIDQCVALNTDSAECFANYNKTCGRHVPYLTILKNLQQQQACANYKINNNLEPLKRLQMLRDCGRDPTDDPESTSYMAVTDCHSLNLLCQVKRNKMPYCQAFVQGECLAGKKHKVQKLLPHDMPFWMAQDFNANPMAHPQIQWPNCAVSGNLVLVTPKGAAKYVLGRLSQNGLLSLYQGDQILRDAALISPQGKILRPLNAQAEKTVFPYVKEIWRIASDGTLWRCHRANNPEEIHAFLTPKGGLFTVKTGWSGSFVYDGKFGFQKAEMQNMRQDTEKDA